MRLVFLNHNVVGRGTFQRAFNIGAEAASRGHDVTLVTTSADRRLSGSERVTRGVRIIEAPDLLTGGARQGWDVWNTSWRIARLARLETDLVHAFDARPTVIGPALTLCRHTGAPLFLDWADWWGRGGTIRERSRWIVRTVFGPIETWFEEGFRQRATANTMISEALRDRCIALGAEPQRMHVMPNGCSAVRARDPDTRRHAREALQVAAHERIVVHVGAVHAADSSLLIEAFRLLRQKVPDARLVLIGTFRGTIPHFPESSGSVMRTGFVTDEMLWQWLAAADVGVVPLRDNIANRARWPGKINDYWSAGLPVVIPGVGAAADYVSARACGVACKATPRSLADGIASVLTSGVHAERMSDNAHLLARDLSWSAVTTDLFEFYERWGGAGTPHERSAKGVVEGV